MLTKRLRKQIEWHFYNYAADKALYDERASEIIESGLTANYSAIGGASEPSNPTERKGMKLYELDNEQGWSEIVRNTFTAFRFKPEYDMMRALYIDRKKPDEIYGIGITSEPTFWRARDRWLECARDWAHIYGLLR